MTHSKQYLGIDPKKIILTGDSAGGNIVAVITIIAIQRGFRVPDGIMLSYPSLNMSNHVFNPSLLLTMDDPILPYPFLSLFTDAYVGTRRDFENPYLSPLYASDEVLKRFPKTRIMVANNDPLRDDSFRLTLKLA